MDKFVDVVFSVTRVTTFLEVVGLLFPATGWVVKLEWPQEVGDGLEVIATGDNFVDNIFDADDSLASE